MWVPAAQHHCRPPVQNKHRAATTKRSKTRCPSTNRAQIKKTEENKCDRNAFGGNCIHEIQFFKNISDDWRILCCRRGNKSKCVLLHEHNIHGTNGHKNRNRWNQMVIYAFFKKKKKVEDSTAFVVSEVPIRCVFTFSLLKNRQRLSWSFLVGVAVAQSKLRKVQLKMDFFWFET